MYAQVSVAKKQSDRSSKSRLSQTLQVVDQVANDLRNLSDEQEQLQTSMKHFNSNAPENFDTGVSNNASKLSDSQIAQFRGFFSDVDTSSTILTAWEEHI